MNLVGFEILTAVVLKSYMFSKRRLSFNRLHGVISQKIEHFTNDLCSDHISPLFPQIFSLSEILQKVLIVHTIWT